MRSTTFWAVVGGALFFAAQLVNVPTADAFWTDAERVLLDPVHSDRSGESGNSGGGGGFRVKMTQHP